MAFDIAYNFLSKDKFTKVAKKVEKATDRVKKKFKKLSEQTKKNRKSSADFTKSFLRLKNVFITGIAGFSIFTAFKKVISAGSEFQDSMADVSAITGITGKDLEKFSKQSRKLSERFNFTSSSILEAFKIIASGKSELIGMGDSLKIVTEKALILSTAAGIDLKDAANALVISLNQFNAGADQSTRFMNVLAAGAKVGASEITNTMGAIKNAGPVARAVGIDFELFNAAIQATAKGGIVGTDAGTKLKAVFLRLSTASKRLGKGFSAIDPTKVGLIRSLEILKNAELSVAQASEIFGDEGITVGDILINKLDILKKWNKELRGTDVAFEQASIRMGTFTFKSGIMFNKIKNKLIELFFKIEPKLNELIERFSEFIDSIQPNDIEKIAIAFDSVTEALTKITGLLDRISTIVRGGTFGGIIGGIIGATVAGPAGIAVGAKVGIAAGIGLGAIGPKTKEEAEQFFLGGGQLGAALQAGFDQRFGRGLSGDAPVSRFSEQKSEAEITVNINAPEGVIQSVKAKSKGKTKFNLGQNTAGGLALNGAT